jgi:hypothetical protein
MSNSHIGINSIGNDINISGDLVVDGSFSLSSQIFEEPAKIELSNPFVVYGDQFTSTAGSWSTYLSTFTGKQVINKAVANSTSERLPTSYSDDATTNPVYSKYSSLVMYGFQDVRAGGTGGTFYANNQNYNWAQSYFAGALTLCLPQSKIVDARSFTRDVGANWTNNTSANYGLSTTTSNAYIETVFSNVQFIAVKHHIDGGLPKWETRVDSVLVNTFQRLNSHTQVGPFESAAYIIDLGKVENSVTVRMTNAASSGTQFIDWVCGWNEQDLSQSRPTLLCSIPRFNYDFTGSSEPFNSPSETKRLLKNEAIESVARTCQRFGLPVSYYNINVLSGMFNTDSINPSSSWSQSVAIDLAKNAIN